MKRMRSSKVVVFIILTILMIGIQVGFLSFPSNTFRGNSQIEPEIRDFSKPFLPHASDPDAYISRWDTTQSGTSGNDQVNLPLTATGTYNFYVDWGDETNDIITAYNQPEVTHTYTSPGIYTINITGIIIGWKFGPDNAKILEIQQWGCLRLGNSGSYFSFCSNLVISANDSLDLSGTTTLAGAFQYCYDLGGIGNMNGWDTSNITDMSYMFYYSNSFNQPIGNWNVSKVTNMAYMFYNNDAFNQPIGNWNVSKVTTMSYMFSQTNNFNQTIGNWNVSSVTNMGYIFYSTYSFNQPLENWDVSSVTYMSSMFRSSHYNQPLENWNVSRVTNMYAMFQSSYFNQPLENWNVSSVTNMYAMFSSSLKFNQPLENWDVSSVTTMNYMFSSSQEFNQPLENWDVSSVTDMSYMFFNSHEFNQPLENWNVSKVTNMQYMFYSADEFNQPLGNWNVSNVTNMGYMFYSADEFNQPLGNWNVSSVTNMQNMFSYITLSREHYDQMLLGWSQLSLQTGVQFHGGYSKYSSIGLSGRDILTGIYGWTITDGSYDPLAGKSVLTSTSETPDKDGYFTLNWTAEYQANNYSLYQFSSPITEINGSLSLLIENSSALSFEINDYLTDVYYFVVTGNNNYGQKLSNCIEIIVDLNPGAFILSSDATSPDLDGIFTISWSVSEVADDYDVFQYSSVITEINSSLIVVASEITTTYVELNNILEGTYYFLVVASNVYNTTLSNCIQVIVNIPETISVTTPSNPTEWDSGSAHYINWTTTGVITYVKIELYNAGALVMLITANTTNDRSFYWQVPTGIDEPISYYFKISDASNASIYGYSDYFTVLPKQGISNITPLVLSIISLVFSAGGVAFLVTTHLLKRKKTRNEKEIE